MKFSLDNLIVKDIYAVNFINIDRKKTFHRSDRKLYAVAFKFDGKTIYRCDGKDYVSDNEHLVLLPKQKEYTYSILEPDLCVMIEFDSDADIPDFYSYKIGDSAEIAKIFKRLYRVWSTKGNGYKLAALNDFYNILYKAHLSDTVSYEASQKRKILQPAVSYVQEHYKENLTNEMLADIVGISEIYFRSLFKKIYHVSPMQYVRNVRIEKAKGLLLGDYNSVSYIAEATGFANIYSFSRTFKKETGVSPTEYKGETHTSEL